MGLGWFAVRGDQGVDSRGLGGRLDRLELLG